MATALLVADPIHSDLVLFAHTQALFKVCQYNDSFHLMHSNSQDTHAVLTGYLLSAVSADAAPVPVALAGADADAAERTGTLTIADVVTARFASEYVSPLDSDTVIVVVEMSPAPYRGLSIPVRVSGTAREGAGADYTLPGLAGVPGGTRTLSVAAGATSAPISIALTDYELLETRSVELHLQEGAGYVLGTPSWHTLSDGLPHVGFATTEGSVVEGAAAAAALRVTISPPSATAITVPLALSGTAAEGADYTLAAVSGATLAGSGLSRVLTIPARTGLAVLSVTAPNDLAAEVPETLVLTLADGTDYDLGTQAMHTLTIFSETPPRLTLSAAAAELTEAGVPSSTTLTLRVSPVPQYAQILSVGLVRGGTAGAGDYSLTLAGAEVSDRVSIPARTGVSLYSRPHPQST